jgi:hypothetical protein
MGGINMNAENDMQKDLVHTTDCLEAVSALKSWKNVFFVVIFLGLLLLQVCFWVSHAGLLDEQQKDETQQITEEEMQADETATPEQAEAIKETVEEKAKEITKTVEKAIDPNAEKIEQAVETVMGDANEPVVATTETKKPITFSISLKKIHVMWTVRTVAFILIITAILYSLTITSMLFVSMIGRLGGINHITRAMILSLIFVVVLLPWQEIFGWFTLGVLFSPTEMMSRIAEYDGLSALSKGLYYIRFVGYWLLALLILFCTQTRTARWSKATLRRLEVI